ncbi:hypothetical protein J7E68_15735, partial [Microbacterium sp. ISL-103]|nr:hypothetical protein [Microbacterium sp. ISL-103]
MNRITSAALGALLLAVALTSCAGTPEGSGTPTPDPPAPSPTASAEPVATQTPAPAVEPTCDTIVSAGPVQVLTDQGWTF